MLRIYKTSIWCLQNYILEHDDRVCTSITNSSYKRQLVFCDDLYCIDSSAVRVRKFQYLERFGRRSDLPMTSRFAMRYRSFNVMEILSNSIEGVWR